MDLFLFGQKNKAQPLDAPFQNEQRGRYSDTSLRK
jgi:hypothetical protein